MATNGTTVRFQITILCLLKLALKTRLTFYTVLPAPVEKTIYFVINRKESYKTQHNTCYP